MPFVCSFRGALCVALVASSAAASPSDIETLRADARTAFVDGNFVAAAALLEKVAARATAPDPELHYLLGEALWALGRESEARVAYARARREIGDATERLPRLWLARSLGRLGDRAGASAIYEALTKASPADPEIALAHAELHIAAHDWTGAEATVRRFLSVRPTHRRAGEMLAWITEAQGQLARELELRARLAKDSTSAPPVRDYGRALERAGDWSGALAMYRRAQRLTGGPSDVELARAAHRMDLRMSVEVAAGAAAKSDPVASSLGAFTGAAIPFGRAHHLAIGASHERALGPGSDGSATEMFAAVSLRGTATRGFGGARIGVFDLGGASSEAMSRDASTTPGMFGGIRRALGGHVELGLDAELGSLWRETPLAVLEGGRTDAATSHLWAFAFDRRVVIDSGVQVRRLRLREEAMGDPRTSQLFAWGGADVTLWSDFARQAAGEVLDDNLLQPTYLASSVVASYRHYELFSTSNAAFTERMSLAERASIDEASLTVRHAALAGRLAVEARGGLGYDSARELVLARGGLSLWIAASTGSRFSFTLDLAKESARALAGERLSGGMTYHVDL